MRETKGHIPAPGYDPMTVGLRRNAVLAAALSAAMAGCVWLYACDRERDRNPWAAAEVVVPALEGESVGVIGEPAGEGGQAGATAKGPKGRCAPASPNAGCAAGTLIPDVVRIGIPELLVTPPTDPAALDPLVGLAEYLGQKIGRHVEFVRLSEYAQFTSGLMSGAIHGALFPPGEYLRARKADPCMKVVGTTLYGTSTSYTTNIIVRRDSKIMVSGDLRGRRIAFSSPSSASGYIFATKFLAERGLLPGVDYQAVFTGGHQETIRAVELGTVDAGATFGRALGTEVKFGRELSEISILAIAGQIPNEPLAFSSALAPELISRISTAFLGLNNMTEDGRRLLGDQEMMSGWVPSDDSTYDGLRETVEDVDRLVRAGDGGTEVER